MSEAIDALDRQIITLLQKNGRMANVDIAREVGVTEATVRKRLERLLSENIIRIVAIPDHAQVGFPVETIILLQVELTKLEEVAQELAKMPAVRSVKLTTGEYDIVFDAVFTTDEELFRFLTEEVATIPGVRKTAVSHVLREVKSSAEWVLHREAPPLIMVVDDDPDFVEIMRTVLSAHGYAVVSASNGEEALHSMRQERPDLVVLDVMMKGVLDGLQASDEMRRDKRLRRIPVLMVSSITSSDYAGLFPTDEYLSVDGFLSKPVEPAQVLREVRRLLHQ